MSRRPQQPFARWARLATALSVAVLTVAACSSASSSPTSLGGTGPGTVRSDGIRTVADVEALVYANRYVDAEAAYAGLLRAHPDDGLTRASYALFLNYRQSFGPARTEASRAVAVAPGLARAHAVLARVEDWTDHLDAAVAEGRRAVALDGSDPLAHLFLSEALADSGDLSGARRALAAARGLINEGSPPYWRAELHREEGNLGHAAGDAHAELAGYSAAFQAQGGWVERPEELASAYLDSGDVVGAHNAIQKALDLTPSDADLLSQLGRIAMLEPDYATADAAFAKLIALRGSDSAALELAAHARFAHRRDLDGAVALLERALTADPVNQEAAAYLIYLERDVRDDGARGRREVADAVAAARDDGSSAARGPMVPDVNALQAGHAQQALAAINAARGSAGLAAVTLDPRLSTSALTHCFYWLFNNNSPTVAKLGIHEETPGLPGFSGVGPYDRDVNFGWHAGPVGEDITHAGDAVRAVGQWVNSVYHRFPIMSPTLSAIGYGQCAVGPVVMEDMEFGLGVTATAVHAPVVYPGDGQREVPAIFSDNELPDPVPAGKPRTTGYPITVTFDPAVHAQVSSFTVAGPNGTSLDAYHLPADSQDGNTATLLPVAPLAAATRYTAHIVAIVDGVPVDRTWSFVTG